MFEFINRWGLSPPRYLILDPEVVPCLFVFVLVSPDLGVLSDDNRKQVVKEDLSPVEDLRIGEMATLARQSVWTRRETEKSGQQPVM